MTETRQTARAVVCGVLVMFLLTLHSAESKPASQEGPCIDCIQNGEEHAGTHDTASQTNDVSSDDAARGEAKPGDVEELMHEGNHVHGAGAAESQDSETRNQEPQNPEGAQDSLQHQEPVDVQQDAQNVPEIQQDRKAEQELAEPHNQAFSQEELALRQEEEDSNPQGHAVQGLSPDRQTHEGQGDSEGRSQDQYEGGRVEELVHGGGNVHDPAHQEGEGEGEGSRLQFGAVEVEHLMHDDKDAHALDTGPPDDAVKEEFKSGDVEQMVHGGEGEGQGEGHVHGSEPDKGQGQGPYRVADVDILGKDSLNVHDPKSRDQMASAGDVSALMGGGGGGGGGGGEGEREGGGLPTVADGEHLMHGAGGHEHDVKQLRFLQTQEQAAAKDRFDDVHGLLMHSAQGDSHQDEGEDETRDETIRRGKAVSYKDIMALGLEEERLRGVDLNKLLLENAQEYADWQRERDVMPGESPEASFWEQIGQLRRRYLSFGTNDGSATDLTATKLDPQHQRWVAGGMGEGEGERGEGGEDSILHQMELLGNTAPQRDRHKHKKEYDYHENGRDITDL